MDKEKVLQSAEDFAHTELEKDSSGHDWWHIYRVTQTAKSIAIGEGADLFICQLAALLHDIADEKLNESETAGLEKVQAWLEDAGADPSSIEHVMEIIKTMSFKGGNRSPMRTLEGMVVQDADRIDAIGAIGIARTFAYSGAKGQLIHDPNLPSRTEMTQQEYRSGKSTAINHFYEKLLLLKNLMNTDYGRKMAENRQNFMETYLSQFYSEWEGQK